MTTFFSWFPYLNCCHCCFCYLIDHSFSLSFSCSICFPHISKMGNAMVPYIILSFVFAYPCDILKSLDFKQLYMLKMLIFTFPFLIFPIWTEFVSDYGHDIFLDANICFKAYKFKTELMIHLPKPTTLQSSLPLWEILPFQSLIPKTFDSSWP